MPTMVDTCWGPKEIDDKPYWHLVSPHSIFYHNVRIAKGALLSVSAAIQAEPQIHNAVTPYSLSRINDEKERVFERVRQEKFPSCPPRLKALFIFDDYKLVERARKEWFSKEDKLIHECRIIVGSVACKVDTIWLNSTREQWEEYADKYWSGQMSQHPFPEIILHGALYFPAWEQFPF